eukprot:TRINITY_DN3384_c1_g1_i1.p1 TRINITY_DN3384_c1_g1~~TRINITY_DN3384_c1_g1_i1.p1  ORF type:complete len:227 (-),score=-14.15 TRINITY_DN3384_c1_g1_i1:298-978(-)
MHACIIQRIQLSLNHTKLSQYKIIFQINLQQNSPIQQHEYIIFMHFAPLIFTLKKRQQQQQITLESYTTLKIRDILLSDLYAVCKHQSKVYIMCKDRKVETCALYNICMHIYLVQLVHQVQLGTVESVHQMNVFSLYRIFTFKSPPQKKLPLFGQFQYFLKPSLGLQGCDEETTHFSRFNTHIQNRFFRPFYIQKPVGAQNVKKRCFKNSVLRVVNYQRVLLYVYI